MKTRIFKRGVAVFLAMLMCFSTFVCLGRTNAYAIGEEAVIYQVAFPRSGDINHDGDWGHGSLTYVNGWYADETDMFTAYVAGSYGGDVCYCIEPGTPIDVGDSLTMKDESFFDSLPSEYNGAIPRKKNQPKKKPRRA